MIYILWFATAIWLFLTVASIRKYQQEYSEIRALLHRCIVCQATVITPVVLTSNYAKGGLREKSAILSGFQNVGNLPVEYTCTEVRFRVDDREIQTMILRQSSVRIPEFQDEITIYYDPHCPEQAFSEDMKRILQYKPLRDCVLYGIVFVICLLSAVFLLL